MEKGEEGSKDNPAEAKGTAGFIFYQNSAGFHYRSVDSLASKTRVQESKLTDEENYEYSAGEVIKGK